MATFESTLEKIVSNYQKDMILRPHQLSVFRHQWENGGDMIVSLPTGISIGIIWSNVIVCLPSPRFYFWQNRFLESKVNYFFFSTFKTTYSLCKVNTAAASMYTRPIVPLPIELWRHIPAITAQAPLQVSVL